MEYTHVTHTFEPIYDKSSRILILGSFPSVKSRENHFYYGHPQNRFWKVTASVFGCPVPATIEEKLAFLKENHIALWDTIASCDIIGSSDSSITNVVPNDVGRILAAAPIRTIFCNGAASHRLFLKYALREGMPPVEKLPSTSPANAAWSVRRLAGAWRICAETVLS